MGSLPDALRPAAERLFGAELPRAERYATLLGTLGVARGLLGPREAERVWERHLLNSAVLALVVPEGAAVVDVGSGAGLPGIPLALARPDLRIVLLEPMLRRVRFLTEVTSELGLGEVRTIRGRAPEDVAQLPFPADCVVARAVAPLERLLGWTMPLIRPGGSLLALRGSTADDEVRAVGSVLARVGAAQPEVLRIGGELLTDPAVVVHVRRLARREARRRPPR